MVELNTFSETWPRSGSMRNGFLYERPMLARPIAGNEFSYRPTATSSDGTMGDIDGAETEVYRLKSGNLRKRLRSGLTGSLGLAREVKHWQTPATFQGKYRRQVGQTERAELLLPEQVENWATPTASDNERKVTVNSLQPGLVGDVDRFHGRPVQEALKIGGKLSKSDQTSLPRLNPRFVEWLMGWPEGWLELSSFVSSETE